MGRKIIKTHKETIKNIQDLCYGLVGLVLLEPTAALHSLLQALLVILRDPVANLFQGKDYFVFGHVSLSKIGFTNT